MSESTAQRWLKFRLGYECKEAKKGVYIDGHEHPDVIKEREAFIEQIDKYEGYVAYNLQHDNADQCSPTKPYGDLR